MNIAIGRRTFLGAGLAAMAATRAGAQHFPGKPVRWIIPFPAAGNYDVTSRLVGEAMGRRLGQTVIPDNRPGAGGIVGTEVAANAPADGYTVVMGSFSVLWIGPYLAGKPSMVPLFAPISLLTTVPMVIAAKADGRFADIKAALGEARAKPGTVSIGHAGNGTTNHIGILRLQVNEKVQFNVIPYKGSGPGLKALLVLSPDRIAQLPDVPSLKDIDSAPFDGGTTAGLFARAETPAAILDTLNSATVAALKDEEVSRKLVELGAVVRPTTRAEFAAYMKDQEVGVSELVKSGLLKPE
jgi:tripartite-type tricarboxylate transporter receptor subunit TctC